MGLFIKKQQRYLMFEIKIDVKRTKMMTYLLNLI